MISDADLADLTRRLAQDVCTLIAEAKRLREAEHYANGVADLAMKHRDDAEGRLEAMAWRPIKTAPPSTAILLYYKGIGVQFGFFDEVGTGDWWVADIGSPSKDAGFWSPFFFNESDPTHWMPLPSDAPNE